MNSGFQRRSVLWCTGLYLFAPRALLSSSNQVSTHTAALHLLLTLTVTTHTHTHTSQQLTSVRDQNLLIVACVGAMEQTFFCQTPFAGRERLQMEVLPVIPGTMLIVYPSMVLYSMWKWCSMCIGNSFEATRLLLYSTHSLLVAKLYS